MSNKHLSNRELSTEKDVLRALGSIDTRIAELQHQLEDCYRERRRLERHLAHAKREREGDE